MFLKNRQNKTERLPLHFGTFVFFALAIFLLFPSCDYSWKYSRLFESIPVKGKDTKTLLGIDVLQNNQFRILQYKTVGLVINHTSVNSDGLHLIDIFNEISNLNVAVIFAPEHGYFGQLSAGEKFDDAVEPRTGARIVSLYGANKIPKDEDLLGLDYLVFDMQDVGSRYYTYVSTMTNVMQSAAKINIPMIILDRPNPLSGAVVDGALLKENFKSFVGLHPIPIRHGLTIGELAVMINESGWLGDSLFADLTIVPLQNWKREMFFPEIGLDWLPPSPNIPDFATALIYNGLCLIEGTNVSEGRGTEIPFKQFGAPWINHRQLTEQLNQLHLSGVNFTSTEFTPISIKGKARWPKYENDKCYGCRINIANISEFEPLVTALEIVKMLSINYPNQFQFLESNFIDKLYGSDELRKSIQNGTDISSLFTNWEKDISEFTKDREKYLIY